MIDQEKIHNQCLSNDPEERHEGLRQLHKYYSLLDQEQAWNDLHRLTYDQNVNVMCEAAFVLAFSLSQVLDKQQAWKDLIRLTTYDLDSMYDIDFYLDYILLQLPNEEYVWEDTIKLINDRPNDVKFMVAGILTFAFPQVQDQEHAWNDLHRLTTHEDSNIRALAANVLGDVFSQVQNKEQASNDLHRLIADKDCFVRDHAAIAIGHAFSYLPDKEQAWNDLHRLRIDEEWEVRYSLAFFLGHGFSYLPDKEQAWNDLHKLISDKCINVRFCAFRSLSSVFSQVPDKEQAWSDLLQFTNHKNSFERSKSAEILGSMLSQVAIKEQVWNELRKLVTDEDSRVRHNAVSSIYSEFIHVPNKQQAWDYLYKSTTTDKANDVRSKALSFLPKVFSYLPDKEQAWNDLLRLAKNKDSNLRSRFAYVLYISFSQVPNKQQAWDYLHKLTSDEDSDVRSSAASALGSAFSQVLDKQQAWNDLHRLIYDEDSDVRSRAASALGFVFSQVLDKQQAWNDLHRLTNDKYGFVRSWAAFALGSSFLYLPDKQQALSDLHRLAGDEYSDVRSKVSSSISYAYSYIPDKEKVWNDLIKLTSDEEKYIRGHANHSLGKISIFKASQAKDEENYRNELEKAIKYFEKASHEHMDYSHPAQFCLPFYRSFYSIVFKRQEAREEVNKYLAEAESAIGKSKNNELLLEAVKNLADALEEVQNLENLDLDTKKCELNFYRRYCDNAAELMKNTDEKAPFATEVLRKGLPILDRNLKKLIEEVQEKAKTACQVSQGTATEEIACAVNRKIQKWEIGSQEEMTENIEDLILVLRSHIPDILENRRLFERIEKIKYETDIVKQYEHLIFIISMLPKVQVINVTQLNVNIAKNRQTEIQIGSINQVSGNTKEEHIMSKIKVLFLASNPKDTIQLALDEEIRRITSKISAAEHRDSIDLISAWAVRPDDLLQMLNKHKPQIVHFSGHGSKYGEIILTSDSGESKPVSSRALKALFTTLKDNLKVVVLNCCYSEEQAKAITQVIDCAVGMSDTICDEAAIIFAASFYRAIGFGRSVKDAFDQGITALLLEDIPEEKTPELQVKDGVDPSHIILID